MENKNETRVDSDNESKTAKVETTNVLVVAG